MNGCAECARLRGVLVRVAELLEDGSVDEAYAFAVAAAEPPIVLRHACPHCPARFEWPGQLSNHLDFAHQQERRAA